MVIVVSDTFGNCRIGRFKAEFAPDEQDEQAHHRRQHRPAHEDVGEAHGRAAYCVVRSTVRLSAIELSILTFDP